MWQGLGLSFNLSFPLIMKQLFVYCTFLELFGRNMPSLDTLTELPQQPVHNMLQVLLTKVRILTIKCKAMSKMRAYQATQRLGSSYNTKTKEYND